MTQLTLDGWVANHPYLRPVAELHAGVEAALSTLAMPAARAGLSFESYASDFDAGVPLLASGRAAIDLAPVETVVVALITKLASADLQGPLSPNCRELLADLNSNLGALGVALSTGALEVPARQGVLRFVACKVLARYLDPVLADFARWRDDERWLRNTCPSCGSKPAMAQLVGHDPGRLRLLACGCCHTRWRYHRTACPFCDNQHEHRLAVIAAEAEAGLRIDYCEVCSGYLKTATADGSEEVLLADWTSLHLDLLARDRGLKRLAGSLYEI